MVGTTHYDDKDGQLYVTTKVFVGSPFGPVVLAEGAPVLANGLVSVKHSTIPVHIWDIVKMTGRAKGSVQAANEWDSDDDSILKSDRAYYSHSLISESSHSTSLSNSNRADADRQKRSLESDHSCRGRQSDHQYSDSELSDVLGTGARVVRARPSTVWKDRLRSADPVSSAIGSRKRRIKCAVKLALPGKGALPSREDSGGSYTHSIYPSHPFLNSVFVDADGEARVEESHLERTRIESARGDSMAAHIFDCYSTGVTDVAILLDP